MSYGMIGMRIVTMYFVCNFCSYGLTVIFEF
ncbi:MAG: hypothetical protein JSC189_000263 [Candidatus Tokpelaia sp. JSC189]|nr:MAG: hypothetical protein JSC189_000263 [Candidatus Tokpelaia sp. JSC189]